MAADKTILQGPASTGNRRLRKRVTPPVAQWTFISLLALFFGLSRTEGALGTFLRSFSTFLFP